MLDKFKPKNKDERATIAYMLSHDRFTYADLERNVGGSKWHRENLVNRLQRMNMLFVVGKERGRKVFSAKDRVAADAYAAEKRRSTPGLMWTAMRSLKTFTPDEVLAICSDTIPQLSRDYVQNYCSRLLKARYTVVEQPARHNVRPARYRLVRDTGPLAPTVRTLECIVDGNTDKVAYVAGDRI